jgi:anti-anti-sigma factor
VLLIRLRGDFDFGNVEMLRRTLRSVSSPVGSRIALDAAEVTFIDVVSIEAILAARHEQRAAGRDLVIVNPSRPVRRLIQLAGLERELTRRPFRLGVARAAR